MKTRPLLITCLIVLLCGSAGLAAAEQTSEQAPAGLQSTDSRHFGTEDRPPNIVYIMADELAYYELSHMGNPHIRTPNIDRLAKQGIRYTQALAAAPVCAPLRCALMTGKHMGHASVRANGGGTPLRQDEETIASLLKQNATPPAVLENGVLGGAIQPACQRNMALMFSLATTTRSTPTRSIRPT